MSPLDKMWASFVAMGLMVVASFLISYARTRTSRCMARCAIFYCFFNVYSYFTIYVIFFVLTDRRGNHHVRTENTQNTGTT